jgi:hypothetical protein
VNSRTPLAVLAALIALLAVPAAILAQEGGTPPGQPPPEPEPEPAPPRNPCERPLLDLMCPDLRMSPPYDLRIDRRIRRGKRYLRATNSINSYGAGPAELFGRRRGRFRARAVQKIQREGGGKYTAHTGARLAFKFIPGQGRYWKYENAARFEIWTVDGMLRPKKRIRTGPKISYCLRDLRRTRAMRRSPRRFHYPACSQNARMRSVTLGTSVGWSDIYPFSYHENWINVTGLRGTFAFRHVADPKNGIWESNESNNVGTTIVRLPSGRAVTRRRASGIDPY